KDRYRTIEEARRWKVRRRAFYCLTQSCGCGKLGVMSRIQLMHEVTDVERAILVSVEPDEEMRPYANEELTALTETAGAEVVGQFHQNRDRPDPAFFLGSGKAEELYAGVQDAKANLVIVDSELSTVQARNLEE